MITVKFKREHTDAQIPTKATKGAACYDAYLSENFKPLEPGELRVVPLGFSVEVPEGYELQVRPRSGLASRGIFVANSPGCVDSDYRGIVGVILHNASPAIQPLERGDRICQLKLERTYDINWEVIDELSETERGEGGFGSTGVSGEQDELTTE